MRYILHLSKNLKQFFNDKAEEKGASSNFIKRQRKLTGSSFVKTLILGNMGDGRCSIDSMRPLLNEEAINVSKQELDFRFNKAAVGFMQSMFMEFLALLKNELPLNCQLLKQFGGVKPILHCQTKQLKSIAAMAAVIHLGSAKVAQH